MVRRPPAADLDNSPTPTNTSSAGDMSMRQMLMSPNWWP